MRRLLWIIPLFFLLVAGQLCALGPGPSIPPQDIPIQDDSAAAEPVNYLEDASIINAWYMHTNNGNEVAVVGDSNVLLQYSGTLATSSTVPAGYSGTSRDIEGDTTEGFRANPAGPCNFNGADQQFTIACWIRPDESFTTYRIVGKYADTAGKRQYDLRVVNSTLTGLLSGDGTNTTSVTCAPFILAGSWYHVAMVYDDVTLTIYINGEPSTSIDNGKAHTSGVASGSEYFYVGYETGACLNGLIDELIVLGRALSPTELAGLIAYGIDGANGAND
jgi:hypothetical protein